MVFLSMPLLPLAQGLYGKVPTNLSSYRALSIPPENSSYRVTTRVTYESRNGWIQVIKSGANIGSMCPLAQVDAAVPKSNLRRFRQPADPIPFIRMDAPLSKVYIQGVLNKLKSKIPRFTSAWNSR